MNQITIVELKIRNKILRQYINSAKDFITKINYLYSDFLLHKHDRLVIDEKTFTEYKSKLNSITFATIEMNCNSNEILKLRDKK